MNTALNAINCLEQLENYCDENMIPLSDLRKELTDIVEKEMKQYLKELNRKGSIALMEFLMVDCKMTFSDIKKSLEVDI